MSDDARRYAFVIEALDAPDTLVRVLTLFAVQPLVLANVSMVRRDSGCAIRIDADGLDPRRAETLLARLDGLFVVRSVARADDQDSGAQGSEWEVSGAPRQN